MARHADAESLRNVRQLDKLRDPVDAQHIGLNHGDRFLLQQFAKRCERVFMLAGGDGNTDAGAQARVALRSSFGTGSSSQKML
jgi:hypothetical protein